MLKQLKTDIKLHKSDLIVPLVLVATAFAVGFGLCALIMFTDVEPGSWFPMGALMGLFCMGMAAIVFSFTMAQEFSLALSMGRTRKDFLGAYALRTLLWQVLCYGLLLVLYRVELALGYFLYPQWPLEVEFSFLFDWRVILGVLVGGNLLTLFLGSLYSYFGKKAMVPLWFVWMAGCILMPNVAAAEPGDGGYAIKSALVTMVNTVPDVAWVLLGLAVVAAMAATVIVLGKKQMVK